MDTQFTVLTVLPFLDNVSLACFLSTSKQMRTYDTKALWSTRYKDATASREDLKKMLHVERLLSVHDPRDLTSEIVGLKQWKLFTKVLRKHCTRVMYACILKAIEFRNDLPPFLQRRLLLEIGKETNNFQHVYGQYRKLLQKNIVISKMCV